MAKAKVVTRDGISVAVEGTPEEVATLVERLRAKSTQINDETSKSSAQKGRRHLPDLVEELRKAEFFKTPQGLSDVREKLAEGGHHYPLTALSGTMQGVVKKRNLRRFKQERKYVYVQ